MNGVGTKSGFLLFQKIEKPQLLRSSLIEAVPIEIFTEGLLISLNGEMANIRK
jgi:hypothetical protein